MSIPGVGLRLADVPNFSCPLFLLGKVVAFFQPQGLLLFSSAVGKKLIKSAIAANKTSKAHDRPHHVELFGHTTDPLHGERARP